MRCLFIFKIISLAEGGVMTKKAIVFWFIVLFLLTALFCFGPLVVQMMIESKNTSAAMPSHTLSTQKGYPCALHG